MKAERLFRAIGLVDEDLIETAAETPAKKRPVWRRYAAAAACLMVLCGAGAAYLVTGGFRGHGASAGGSGINNADSAAERCGVHVLRRAGAAPDHGRRKSRA